MRHEESLERLAAGLVMIGFPAESPPPETRELIAQGVRNFILFGPNVRDADQLRTLSAELRTLAGQEALIAIDHEGGRVNRLQGIATPWPSPMAWSATGDLLLVQRASAAAARELTSFGINLNFAPVADILADHRNAALGARCFADEPATVAAMVAAFARGHREGSVGTTAKHFPGHGATPVDSHLELPRVDRDPAELRGGDLIPFAAAVAAGVDCLMVSHVWYAGLDDEPTPATMSQAVTRLARDDLAFDGVIVSDCLEMGAIQTRMTTGQAVVGAVLAGIDLPIVSHRSDRQREGIAALVTAVRQGIIPVERLLESHQRLARLRDRLRGTPVLGEAGDVLALEIARRAVTLVRDADSLLPIRLPADSALGVVTFPTTRVTLVESAGSTPPLVEAARRHSRVVPVAAAGESDPAARVLLALQDVDLVLVGTTFATGDPRQADVVRALLAAGKQVVVVALRDPFDLLTFPEAPCFLAAYDGGRIVAETALSIIFGEEKPRGHLPVALPDLYPRGHGLAFAE